MIDLFPVTLCLNISLLFLKILVLKPTVRQLRNQTKNVDGKQINIQLIQKNKTKNPQQSTQRSSFCQTLVFMVRNYTIFCICGQKYKKRIMMQLFICSIINFFVYFTANWQVALAFGPSISLIFFVSKCRMFKQKYQKTIKNQVYSQQTNCQSLDFKKIVYLSMALISMSLQLTLCGLCYKNYINSHIYNYLINFLIAIAAETFAVRPLFIVIFSLISWQSEIVSLLVDSQRNESSQRVVNQIQEEMQSKNNLADHWEIQPNEIQNLQEAQIQHIVGLSSLQEMFRKSQKEEQGKKLINQQQNKNYLKKLGQQQLEIQNTVFADDTCENEPKFSQHTELQKLDRVVLNNKNENIQTKLINPYDILEDFICDSNFSKQINKESCLKDNTQDKQNVIFRKISSRRKKRNLNAQKITYPEKNTNLEHSEDLNHTKQINNYQLTKYQKNNPVNILTKEKSCSSNNTKTENTRDSFLKIHQESKQIQDLQEVQTKSHRMTFNSTFFASSTIPQDRLPATRKHKRRVSKCQLSQPYIPDRIIDVYMPDKRSEADLVMKKKILEQGRPTAKAHKKLQEMSSNADSKKKTDCVDIDDL